MKDYSKYSVSDFTQDDKFLEWVKRPGAHPELDAFWDDWVVSHPEQVTVITEAKSIIQSFVEETQYIPDATTEKEVWARLKVSIENEEAAKKKSAPSVFSIAAVIVAILLAGGTAIYFTYFQKPTAPGLALIRAKLFEETNNTKKPKTIVLSDGSSVVLQPNSTLQFPRKFDSDYREVYLSGEAFFEVSKDAEKPFLVYVDKVVTKVLGTSFNIRAFENEDVSVQVKTGKVSVTQLEESYTPNKQLDGVLLAPNQQATYSREKDIITKSLVDNPVLLSAAVKQSFAFHDATIDSVFSMLEKAYGVEIVYDAESIGKCSINAALEDMPLYDKMRLICKSIDADYEILDSHIIVTGKGCLRQ